MPTGYSNHSILCLNEELLVGEINAKVDWRPSLGFVGLPMLFNTLSSAHGATHGLYKGSHDSTRLAGELIAIIDWNITASCSSHVYNRFPEGQPYKTVRGISLIAINTPQQGFVDKF